MSRTNEWAPSGGLPRSDPAIAQPGPSTPVPTDTEVARGLAKLETRADEVKERFRAHFARNQEIWVVREAMALTAERTFPTLRHSRPRGVPQNAFAELMLGQARHNVQARAMTRMSAINSIAGRMQAAVTRTVPDKAEAPYRVPANDPIAAPRPRQQP